jgi:hypothetical protein
MHTDALAPPVPLKYVLAGHEIHVEMLEAPVLFEYFPAPHEMHVLELVADTEPEYFPAGQELQVCESASEKVPAGQLSTETVTPEVALKFTLVTLVRLASTVLEFKPAAPELILYDIVM